MRYAVHDVAGCVNAVIVVAWWVDSALTGGRLYIELCDQLQSLRGMMLYKPCIHSLRQLPCVTTDTDDRVTTNLPKYIRMAGNAHERADKRSRSLHVCRPALYGTSAMGYPRFLVGALAVFCLIAAANAQLEPIVRSKAK